MHVEKISLFLMLIRAAVEFMSDKVTMGQVGGVPLQGNKFLGCN